MADNTQLNANITEGDILRDEDLGAGVKMPVSKIYTGATGVDGGPVTVSNPLPTEDHDTLDTLHNLLAGLSGLVDSLQAGEFSINLNSPAMVGADTASRLHMLLTDTIGRLNAVGPTAPGTAIALAGNPLYIGLSDGTLVRARLGDTSGRAMAVGAAATGATVANAGNPVVVAGSDGTNSRSIRTDTLGELYLVCDAAPAAAVPAAVNVTAGADAQSKVRTFLTDTMGKQQITELGVEGQLDALIDRMDQMLLIMQSLSGNTTQ